MFFFRVNSVQKILEEWLVCILRHWPCCLGAVRHLQWRCWISTCCRKRRTFEKHGLYKCKSYLWKRGREPTQSFHLLLPDTYDHGNGGWKWTRGLVWTLFHQEVTTSNRPNYKLTSNYSLLSNMNLLHGSTGCPYHTEHLARCLRINTQYVTVTGINTINSKTCAERIQLKVIQLF